MAAEATTRPNEVPFEAPGIRIPSVLWCGLLIFWMKLLLRVRGFSGTFEWVRRRLDGIETTMGAHLEAVRVAEYRVAMAGALYPGRALCLEQSLTLYYLLRKQGVGANYCQGIQPHPFEAHAWVEYRGEPINDVIEHVHHFARLAPLP